MNNKDDAYKQKFMAFAIRMVKLKNYLNEQKHEYNIADQIQPDEQFNSLYADAEEVMRMLTRSILSARKRVKK